MTEVLVALGGFTVALLSVWIGSLLNGRREYGNWLRDNKLKAYSELVTFINSYRFEYADDQTIRTFAREFGKRAAPAMLLAPKSVRDQLDRVSKEAYAAHRHVRKTEGISMALWLDPVFDELGGLETALRGDLHDKPRRLPTKS